MIATRLTLMGKCKEAMDMYCKLLKAELVDVSLFAEHKEQFPVELGDNRKDLIYSAKIKFTYGEQVSYIHMADSPVLAFTDDVRKQGCRDNITFDMELKSSCEVEEIYYAFMECGAKNNVSLQARDGYGMYCSFIDQFGVCWNLYCS